MSVAADVKKKKLSRKVKSTSSKITKYHPQSNHPTILFTRLFLENRNNSRNDDDRFGVLWQAVRSSTSCGNGEDDDEARRGIDTAFVLYLGPIIRFRILATSRPFVFEVSSSSKEINWKEFLEMQ